VHRITLRVNNLFLSQIISQKDEHCWVGELNGLRGKMQGYEEFSFFFLWEIPPVKGIWREPMGVNEGVVGGHRDVFVSFRAKSRSIDNLQEVRKQNSK